MKKSPRILIIRNDHIGDLLFSTSVFRELKEKIPGCRITLIASKLNRSLIEKNKNIDKIIELEMPSKNFRSLYNYYLMSRILKKERFDIGIDLRGSQMNAILLWFSKIKVRIGKTDAYESKFKQKLISLFFNKPIFLGYYSTKDHQAKENLEIVNRGMGFRLKNFMPEVIWDKKDEMEVDDFLKENKIKNYMCICPFAGIEVKQWPLENFREIIRWADNLRYKILVLGIKNDEKGLNNLVKDTKNCKTIINFDLRKMTILFKKSSLVLGHDGGPIHIASAAGANLIELVPLLPPILSKGKCIPLGNGKKEIIWAKKDMSTIKIEDVKKSIRRMLNKRI